MNYYITIKDVDNQQNELILHFAESDSVLLDYNGDEEAPKPLVGSSLSFSILVNDCTDGKYDEYFTTDEKKWKTQLWKDNGQQNDALLWQGYLLPETYYEPWGTKTFFVDFEAVDGLGLLKGKYFKDDFYEEEKTVIEFICAALEETKVSNDLYIDEAINNRWLGEYNTWQNTIIKGGFFKDSNGEKKSMYDVLESIIGSMQCQLYHWADLWYMEGINKRNFLDSEFKKFKINTASAVNGTYTNDKNVKNVTWIDNPVVTMKPPFKKVSTSHKKEPFKLSDDIVGFTELPFDYNLHEETDGGVHSKFWNVIGSGNPMINLGTPQEVENSLVYLTIFPSTGGNNYIELRNKPYVLEGVTLNLELEVQLVFTGDLSQARAQELVNCVVYNMSIDGVLIYTNENVGNSNLTSLNFDTNGKAKVELTHKVSRSGVLDFRFYAMKYDNSTEQPQISSYGIKKLKIKQESDEDEVIFETKINAEASTINDIDLKISDDETRNTLSWQLDYLDKQAVSGNFRDYDVYYAFREEMVWYNVVDLKAAYDAETFKVYYSVAGDPTKIPAENVKIFYNYKGGEETVITFDNSVEADKFHIFISPKRKPSIERYKWLQWQDSIYRAGFDRYGKTVANVVSNTRDLEYKTIEGDCLDPIKFNDIIGFEYQNQDGAYKVDRCTWNISKGQSKVMLSECFYNGHPVTNMPPFVYAGEDMLIYGSPSIVRYPIAAKYVTFYSNLAFVQWTKISGNNDVVIVDPSDVNTGFTNMTGNHYEFRLKITDSLGRVGSDSFVMNRLLKPTLKFNKLSSTNQTYSKQGEFELKLDPNIPNDTSVNLFYDILIDVDVYPPASSDNGSNSYIQIVKNGKQIYYEAYYEDNIATNGYIKNKIEKNGNVLQIKPTDTIKINFYFEVNANVLNYFINNFFIRFNRSEKVMGYVEPVTLPMKLSLSDL